MKSSCVLLFGSATLGFMYPIQFFMYVLSTKWPTSSTTFDKRLFELPLDK